MNEFRIVDNLKNDKEIREVKMKKKMILIIVLSALALLVAGWWIFCVAMYNSNFNVRCKGDPTLMLRVEDFEGL